MRVLAIPEDFRKDQYILKPILTAMLSSLGKPRARVAVCRDPLLGGVEQALRWEMLEKILYRYRGMVDLIILCVDRDGKPGRRKQLDLLERRAASLLESQQKLFVAENAWQELEVWVLAGLDDLPAEWSWDEIRQEIDPKERYFNPVVSQRGLEKEPGGGRRPLAQEAAHQYKRIRRLCQEDIYALEMRIRAWID